MIAGAVVYGIAGLWGVLATSLDTILVSRAILGVSVACIMTASTALVGDYFAGGARDRFMGWQTAVIASAGFVFLNAGGFLADLSWRGPFALYGVSFLYLPLVLAFIVEPVRARPISQTGGTWAGVPLFGVATFAAIAFLSNAAFYLMPTQLPFYLAHLGQPSPRLAGVLLGSMAVAAAVTSAAYGRIRRRLQVAAIFSLSFASLTIGMALMALMSAIPAIAVANLLMGAGLGTMFPNLMAAGLGLAPPHARGKVAGLLTSGIFVGQFSSPLISQPLIDAIGFTATFGCAAVLIALLFVVALVFAVRERRSQADP